MGFLMLIGHIRILYKNFSVGVYDTAEMLTFNNAYTSGGNDSEFYIPRKQD